MNKLTLNNYTRYIVECINDNKETDKKELEKHHIIPRSVGGDDDTSNIVYLTSAQHCYAHILWDQITGNNTSTFYRNLLAEDGHSKSLNEITYEDCLKVVDIRNKCRELASQAQKDYWADEDKRSFRIEQYRQAKLGKENSCKGRLWVINIKDASDLRRVKKEELNVYLNNGYALSSSSKNIRIR